MRFVFDIQYSRRFDSSGSALLLVVLLSWFMLASFLTFSSIVRDSIRERTDSRASELIKLDSFRESFQVSGTGSLPEWYFLDPAGPIGYSSFVVFSGSSQLLNWKQSGNLELWRIGGAPFCYTGTDGGSFIEGCIPLSPTSQTDVLNLTSPSGTLTITSLWGYSGVSVSPVDSIERIAGNARLRIFRVIGNTSFLEHVLPF